MCLGDGFEVIRFVGVREHPVGQRGVDRGGHDVRGEDGRLRDAALCAYVLDGHFTRLEAGA